MTLTMELSYGIRYGKMASWERIQRMDVPGCFLHLRMCAMSVSVFVHLIQDLNQYMRFLFSEVFSLLKVEMLCRILIKSHRDAVLGVSKEARIF